MAKLKVYFRQVQQVKGLTKNYKDRSGPLVVSTPHLNFRNMRLTVEKSFTFKESFSALGETCHLVEPPYMGPKSVQIV